MNLTYHLHFKNALEKCRVNGILSLSPSSIMLLYMKNLHEPCLVDIIMGISLDELSAWTKVADMDKLREKVEDHLEEYEKLQASFPANKKSNLTPSPPTQNGSDDTEWNKRMRRVCAGSLRGKTKEQQVGHLCGIAGLSKSGCFLHDHDNHQFMLANLSTACFSAC